tara:strand:+ start:320 stop:610 length:291 start_codon:yes stop_codon:yes gene_type:complete
MKLTKSQLRQIIKEELESALSSEAAGASPAAKQKADVERIGKKLGKVSGLENLTSMINDRVELQQFLGNVLRMISDKLKPTDIKMVLAKLYKAQGK